MKKSVFIMLFLSYLVCYLAVFAQTASQNIVVRTVTGKVEREVSAGKWEPVTENMKLTSATVINTSLATAKTGIKLGSQVTQSKVSADQDQGRTNISTASTRASDATKDLEWIED